MAQARDGDALHEEHHARQVGRLHFRRLQRPHVLGGKLLRVQTEQLSWEKQGKCSPAVAVAVAVAMDGVPGSRGDTRSVT